jgi:hypothetical protein
MTTSFLRGSFSFALFGIALLVGGVQGARAEEQLPPFPQCSTSCPDNGDNCSAVCRPGQVASCRPTQVKVGERPVVRENDSSGYIQDLEPVYGCQAVCVCQ